MRRIVGLTAFFLVTAVLIFSPNQANAICCFPYNMNYYVDPVTGNFVLNGELNNDSYQQKPFGNTSYRFVFSDKDNNTILERNILLTDILPIKGGVTIPLGATFPFQIVMSDIDPKVVQQISNFRIDGTNNIDYFGWKPADLAVSSSRMINVGMIHGQNGDVFTKWKISGNITNTNSKKTENAYVVASLRDKNDNILGVAGYSTDSVQPATLNGFETKDFELFALIPALKTPSSANLYVESDDSSMIFPYYKPIIIRDTMNYDERNVTDPKKPVSISANITNISRNDLDLNWIIQIKKSPKSTSEGDITEYPESKIAFVKSVSGHISAQKSTKLEYSWTPQSNGIYFYEMYVWDSTNAKALSYPVMQSFLTDSWLVVESNLNSVKSQIKSGIPLDKIQCVKGLEFAHKASNGNLVCVKPETKEKLIQRGWTKTVSIISSIESKYDPYNTRCSYGVIPLISKDWQSLGLHQADKDWETLGKDLVRQKFYQELKNRDIIFEPACFGVNTGSVEESYPPRFAMCSIVTAPNGTKIYLEGTVNEFDIKYFNIDNKIPYQCDEHHSGCLCQTGDKK